MSKIVTVHPDNPYIRRLTELSQPGTVFAYPTSLGYALGCKIQDTAALEKIRRIRQLNQQHRFTLVCEDLKTVSNYAFMSTPVFKMIKACTPTTTTFILKTAASTPKKLYNKKHKEIGVRIHHNPVVLAIMRTLGSSVFISASAFSANEVPADLYISAEYVSSAYPNQIDIIIETNPVRAQPSSLINCTQGMPFCERQGIGTIPANAVT